MPMTEFGRTIANSYFDHVERQINLAVTKAGLLLTAIALLFNAYIRVVVDLKFFASIEAALAKHLVSAGTRLLLDGGFIACGVLLVVAFLFALISTIPKMRPNPQASPDPHAVGDNILFYGFVATLTPTAFADAFEKEDDDTLARDLLRQAAGKSAWLKAMYRRLQIATWSTFVALLVGFVTAVFAAGYLVP